MKWPAKTSMRDAQTDDTALEDTGFIASLKPTMTGEESMNSDPGEKGYNRTNSRTGKGGTSNRFKK